MAKGKQDHWDIIVELETKTSKRSFRIEWYIENNTKTYLEDNLWRHCFDLNSIVGIKVNFIEVKHMWIQGVSKWVHSFHQTVIYKPNYVLNKLTSKFNLIIDNVCIGKM